MSAAPDHDAPPARSMVLVPAGWPDAVRALVDSLDAQVLGDRTLRGGGLSREVRARLADLRRVESA